MSFEIYIPSNLTFQDYIAVTQCSRTLADGYDRKDPTRLLSSLAPTITVDYTSVVPSWGIQSFTSSAFVSEWLGPQKLGVKALVTQHMLGAPYFKSVTSEEIVVEWQQMASHGRWEGGGERDGGEGKGALAKIGETSDGRSWMQQTFVKVEGQWRIKIIRPEVIYHTGDFRAVGRPDGE